MLWRCCSGGRKGIRPVKTELWGAGVVICLERGADLHVAQLMPLPLGLCVLAVGNYCIGVQNIGNQWRYASATATVILNPDLHKHWAICNWNTHTHPFNVPLSGTIRVSRYQKGTTNLDFTEARDNEWHGISWAICKSAPHSKQITTPAPHHSVFYRPDALPAAQPTVSTVFTHFKNSFTSKLNDTFVIK